MHPDRARLVTGLPGIRPRVMVEPAGDAAWELPMTADTLWIDTGRALCTLTWRGRLQLERRDARGRIRVGFEEPGRAVQWPAAEESKPQRAIPPQPPIPRAPPRPPAPAPSRPEVVDEISVLMETVMGEPVPSEVTHGPEKVLPFVDPPPPSDGNPFHVRTLPFAQPAAEAVRSQPGAWAPGATGTMNAVHALGALAMPFGTRLRRRLLPPPRSPAPALAGREPSGAPAADAAAFRGVRRTPHRRGACHAAAVFRQTDVRDPGRVPRPDGARRRVRRRARGVQRGGQRAGSARPCGRAPGCPGRRGQSERRDHLARPDACPLPRAPVSGVGRVDEPAGQSPPDNPGFAEAWAKVDRADVAAVLTRALPLSDVQGAVNDAVTDDGLLDTPVVMVAGDLEISFDEVETLKLHLAGATPLAGADKKLKETVDLAAEVQKTPFGALPEVAAGWSARIREAWVKAPNRTLPADYLETHCRRLLLEQRAYQRRDLCNETWIRAAITPAGTSTAVPTYLPDAVARWLPLFSRFPARILAEAVPQQDEAEAAPCALRAVAVARVLSGRSRGR